MRVLALDYGRARCGCAVSDPTGVLATPIEPVRAPMTRRGLARLRTLVRELEVERVVVGLPLSLSGRDSAQTGETRAFAARLEQELPVPVELHDERFTTRLAERMGGSADEDSRAAAHLLEGWLARQPGDMEGRDPVAGGAGRRTVSGRVGSRLADGYERTSGEREEARRQRYRSTGGGPGRPRDRARKQPPPRRRPTRPRRRHSWAGRIFALLALVLAAAAIWFLVELFQPFHGSPRGQVTVRIPAHSTARQVGDQLARDGVIPSGFFFEVRATLAGDRGDLLSGTYHLQLGMTYGAVLKILTTPPPAAKTTNITIVEGRTRAQINDLLRSQGVKGSYFVATRRSPLINLAAYGAPRHTPDLEGFLFPDTYQLVEPVSIEKLVDDQLRTFRREFARVNLSYARSKHLTPYDVLIIASMVQAEAGHGPRPAAGRLGHLQPAEARDAAPAGRHHPLRHRQLHQAAHAIAAELALAVQHAQPQGPAADADRQSGPGRDSGRGAPRSHQVPVLRSQGVRQRGQRVRVELPQVPGRRAEVSARAQRSGWPLARALQVVPATGLGR